MQKPQKVAVFDIDGTIFRSSFLIELSEAMVKEGLFPKSARTEYEREHRKWFEREGGYQNYIDSVVYAFVKHLKGVHYGDFRDAAKQVVAAHEKQVYRYTRDLVPELKKKGFFLLAISQSPKAVLDGFCKKMGFDKVYGRLYELGPNDRFTGVVIDEHIIGNKGNVLRRAIEKENLTLKGSIGVGDTEGDIAFLEMVENPICFNPNKKLYKTAKRMGWKVVVERKDVIYDIC